LLLWSGTVVQVLKNNRVQHLLSSAEIKTEKLDFVSHRLSSSNNFETGLNKR